MNLKIYSVPVEPVRRKPKSKSGQIPLLALLVIFGLVSLISVMAFFIAILALQK